MKESSSQPSVLMPLKGNIKCRRMQHRDCICALILQFRCQPSLLLWWCLCRSCSESGEQPTLSFFSLSSELRWGVAVGFLPPQLCCFSHGTVLILQSEGWHHRNNIHLAPAKNILATCKIITKLPLICVCFLTVEFRICGGGAQTALDACTQLPVTVTPEKRDKAAERKESSWGNEHPYGRTHPTEHGKEKQGAEFSTSLGLLDVLNKGWMS